MYLRLEMAQTDEDDDTSTTCLCCGRKWCNVSPKILMAFSVTLIILTFSICMIFLRPETTDIFIPLMMGIAGVWMPSPAQIVYKPPIRPQEQMPGPTEEKNEQPLPD
jgi:hypothetical protein